MNSVSNNQKRDSIENKKDIKIKSANSNSLTSVYKMKLQNKLSLNKNLVTSSNQEDRTKKLNDNTLELLQKLVKKDLANEIKEKIIQVLNEKDNKKTQLKANLVFLIFL